MAKVLLTGGSGFIAAHILELLLKRGYEVVTTVRSEDKASKIRAAHPNANLTVVIVPDIAQPDAFDEVVKTPGLEAVLHTASPFHFNFTDAKTELLDPAIMGTTSILKALKSSAPGVKRVVVTSSFASILSVAKLEDPTKVFSEADWNPNTYEQGAKGDDKAVSYRVSKTLAERAAWKFVDDEKPNFDLATINPPLVFGPVVHHINSLAAINTSNARFVDLIQGKMKDGVAPTGTHFWVDVRDVAKAHVEAMERTEAGGKRFFCTAGNFCNKEIVEIMKKKFPDLKDQLPGEDFKGGEYPEKGPPKCDNSRATKVLGIEWISLEKSVVDTVTSLQALGA
ncbi:putative NAD dependent epimerase/dehydratase [Pseudomassariella vexata]|uniref:Putative NAD dependent epimerase/dehydratase n=1 Tax=Pseudomassariella vexata TaxID=1141098 RepID=A0A1Y2DXZ9_9PEZI|nr:putative NAD dependent epimerase/dehydratase [Pseudomassariella vexata]ORY64123.1 putative NAD dependent epimerase/dehydratase [Pseudomassariella vexata]